MAGFVYQGRSRAPRCVFGAECREAMNGDDCSVRSRPPLAGRREDDMSENLSPAQIRSNPHPFFPEVVGSLLAKDDHPLPEIVTPLDVETVWRIPRSSQKNSEPSAPSLLTSGLVAGCTTGAPPSSSGLPSRSAPPKRGDMRNKNGTDPNAATTDPAGATRGWLHDRPAPATAPEPVPASANSKEAASQHLVTPS